MKNTCNVGLSHYMNSLVPSRLDWYAVGTRWRLPIHYELSRPFDQVHNSSSLQEQKCRGSGLPANGHLLYIRYPIHTAERQRPRNVSKLQFNKSQPPPSTLYVMPIRHLWPFIQHNRCHMTSAVESVSCPFWKLFAWLQGTVSPGEIDRSLRATLHICLVSRIKMTDCHIHRPLFYDGVAYGKVKFQFL